jgi:hypothetical protein
MKKLLLLLSLLPVSASAQLIEVGFNGGIIPHSKYQWADASANTWDLKKESQKTYTAGGRIGLNFASMQLGVMCDYQSIMYKSSATGTSPANPVQVNNIENDIATSFIATCLYLNKAFQAGGGYFYIGVAGGYAVANMSSFDVMDDGIIAPWLNERTAKAKGFMGGGQVGYVMGIARRVGFSLEVGLRYAELNSDYPKQGSVATNYLYKNTLFYVPTQVGFRFQLGRGCDY